MTDARKIVDHAYPRKQKALMQKWMKEHSNIGMKRFICDGIADYNNYGTSCPRICFLLKECYFEGTQTREDCKTLVEQYMRETGVSKKEAEDKVLNDKGHSFWLKELGVLGFDPKTGMQYYDLAAHLGKGEPWYMWKRITKWIDYMKQSFGWEDSSNDITNIQRLAVVNIKKSDGTSNSADGSWEKFAESDRDLLIQELELINPQIIICGGTYAAAVKNGLLGKVKKTISGDRFIRSVSLFAAPFGVQTYLVFDTIHPSYPACGYEPFENQIKALAEKMKQDTAFEEKLESLV